MFARTMHCFAAAALITIGASLPVVADEGEPAEGGRAGAAPANILDGQTFAGEIGSSGESADTEDLFMFRDGMFLSKECERRCGYSPAPYWVRYVEDGVQVHAEAKCEDADATMVWTGTVKGDTIEGTIAWTSERWYWTIEKEMWFKGKLTASEQGLQSDAQ